MLQVAQQPSPQLYPALPIQMNLPHLPQKHPMDMLNSDFIKFLSFDDLHTRLNSIDTEMEREIEELYRKYTSKRQPILDAIDAKRKRQQSLNNNLIKI